jgi:hypothetical protein
VTDERAAAAIDHLQKAALEVIEAARAALDLLEDVVQDPAGLAAVLTQVGQVADSVVSSMARAAAASSTPPDEPATGEPPGPAASEPTRVQHIPVR